MPNPRIVAAVISGIVYLGFIANLQQVANLNKGIPLNLQSSTSNPIQYARELVTLMLAAVLARGAVRVAHHQRAASRMERRNSTALNLFFIFVGIPTAESLLSRAIPPIGVLIGLRFVYILLIALSISRYSAWEKLKLTQVVARNVCVLVVIEAAIAAYQAKFSPPTLGTTFLGTRPWGTYSSPNNLGLAFLGSAILIVTSKVRLWWLWFLVSIIGCVVTGSRAAIIGAFLIVVGISVRRMRFRLAFVPGLALALYGVYSTASSQEVSGRQIHGEKRFQTWADALATSKNLFQTVFGQGIGVGTNGVTTKYGLQNINGPGISDSSISAAIIATGIVGVCFYLYAFYRLVRTMQYELRPIIIPALLVAGISFNVPEVSPFNILLAVAIGCSIAPRIAETTNPPAARTAPRNGRGRLSRTLAGNAVIASSTRWEPERHAVASRNNSLTLSVVDPLATVEPAAVEVKAPSSVRAATRAGLSRGFALAIGLVLTSVTTRIAISDLGLGAFGVLTLIAAIVTLLPFADLGLGAAIMSTLGAARTQNDIDRAKHTVARSLRLLYISAAVLLLADSVMYCADLWPQVLGSAARDVPGLANAATAAFALIALTVPLGIGNRIFIGLHKTDRVPLFSLITYVSTLTITVLAHFFGLGFWLFVIAWPAGAFASALATTWFGLHAMGYSFRSAIADSLKSKHLAGDVSVGSYARPMFILSVAAPIALQTDRLVLSHISSRHDLAAYALVAQLYGPLYSLVQTAGTALWPIFARHRTERSGGATTWVNSMLAFAIVGLILGVVLVLAGPLYAKVVARDISAASGWLYCIFAILLVVQAIFSAASARFTTPDGLKVQAKLAVISTLANFVLSVVLARHYGAVGPVIASAACISMLQIAPLTFIGRRDMNAGRLG